MSRDGAFSRAQPTQLYTFFGFRANALNSHSPPSLPGFDPGSAAFQDLFGAFS